LDLNLNRLKRIGKRKLRHGRPAMHAVRNDEGHRGLFLHVTWRPTMTLQTAATLLGTPYFGTPQPPMPAPFPQPGPPQPEQPEPEPDAPQPEDPIQTPDTM
jgi:hypothetical protein